ncbi:hypothetical protein P3T18_006018 [Paraburkholderia sp. GAS199]|uniref:hypothetical protein n=1 Tax=Paraburkholderia sp. GAS199 TaxID=3035126 RepID=UPI003D1B4623
MSSRIDKSWLVFESIENAEHDRCVDLFLRTDNTYGFEEFRRDVEDRGIWTPVQFYSGVVFPSREDALAAALNAVVWLEERVREAQDRPSKATAR